MAVPRFSTGKTSIGTTETSGKSTPEAAACSTRPQMSRKNVGAAAQSAVPAANVAVAAKKSAPQGLNSFPTHGPLFACLLLVTILLVGGLTFLPTLALGPIAEQLSLGF